MGTAMSCNNNIGMIISPMLGGIAYDKSGRLVVFAIMISLGAIDIVSRLLINEPPRTTASISVIINTVVAAGEKDEKLKASGQHHHHFGFTLQ